MRKKVVETCEMCSRETQEPTTIKVEGALLRVCSNCVSFGNVVEERKSSTRASSSRKPTSRRGTSKSSSSGSKRNEEDKEVLIDNYGEVIKKARMKKKLTQDQLSSRTGVSQAFIRSIENQNMRPTDKVARKIEHELGVKLFETLGPELEHQEKSNKKGLTVGDIVKITRYEYD